MLVLQAVGREGVRGGEDEVEKEAERERLQELARRLGGEFVMTSNFDPRCSHMLLLAPKRSEKLLAALAGGRWLLKKSWLDACDQAGGWAAEEEHELYASESEEISLGKGRPLWGGAARSRRLQRELQGRRIFDGCTAIIADDTFPAPPTLQRILEAGGAHALLASEMSTHMPAMSSASSLLVVVPENATSDHPWVQRAATLQAKCVPPAYVIEALTLERSQPPPALPAGA